MSTIAEIHGKPISNTSEDVLTSSVLGGMRYLPAEDGLLGWLRTIRGLGERLPAPDDGGEVVLHFWPLSGRREPDALVELRADGRVIHVQIEAKYLSGPSDTEMREVELDDETTIEEGNQLADQLRELDAGQYSVWEDGARDRALTLSSAPEDRHLLYLTAHPTRPRTELERAAGLYPEAADRLTWASWYDIHAFLSDRRQELDAFPYRLVVADLLALLDRKDFGMFSGVRRPRRLVVDVCKASFWVGPEVTFEREEAVAFEGIRAPEQLRIHAGAGRFWRQP